MPALGLALGLGFARGAVGSASIPETPTGFAGFVDVDQAVFSADRPETDPTNWNLYRHTTDSFAGASVVFTFGPADLDPGPITGLSLFLPSGAPYFYWLTATNAAGESAPTASVELERP